MDIQGAFAANLREHRKAAGLSQEKLAEIAGLHRTYIGGIEQCRINVSLKNIGKIARALGIDPALLFHDSGDADTVSTWEKAANDVEVTTAALSDLKGTPDTRTAIATWTDEGIEFHPVEARYEDITIQVLVNLVRNGCTGSDLAAQYDLACAEIMNFLESRS